MIIKYSVVLFLLVAILLGCAPEINCADLAIQPVFIGLDSSDVDTIIVKKFKPNDNYQNLIDTFIATSANSTYYTLHDSITVYIDYFKQTHQIKADYDWQIFVPSKNRIVSISDIISEKKTTKRSVPEQIYCANRVFSLKMDNQLINLPSTLPDTVNCYTIYIHN